MKKELRPEELRRRVLPEDVAKKTDETDVGLPVELVGQERVREALELCLMKEGHMAIVTEGASSALAQFLEKTLREKTQGVTGKAAKDYCYVHNFKSPNSPILLSFPVGEAENFKLSLENIFNRLAENIPLAVINRREAAFKQELFPEYQRELGERFAVYFYDVLSTDEAKEDLATDGLVAELAANKTIAFQLHSPESGGAIDISQLPEPQKQLMIATLQAKIANAKSKCFYEINSFVKKSCERLLASLNQKLQEAEANEAQEVVDSIFAKTMELYREQPLVEEFLNQLKGYAAGPPSPFLPAPVKAVLSDQGVQVMEDAARGERIVAKVTEKVGTSNRPLPFKVNVIVKGSASGEIPIITDLTPTYTSLFGVAEKELMAGYVVASDHSKIKPGKFHQAYGGYLILDLNEIFEKNASLLLGLKRTLKEQGLRIIEESEEFGISGAGKKVTPEPLPLNCKIIIIVKPEYYYLSWEIPLVKDLVKHFSIRAEFKRAIDLNSENIRDYLSEIERWAKDENLLPCTPRAGARLIEVLLENTSDQKQMSVNMDPVKNIYREADFYAKEIGSFEICLLHVETAITKNTSRSNLIEEHTNKARKDGLVTIRTTGWACGEVNALAVSEAGSYQFGSVIRMTATARKTRPGEPGGVDTVDRGTFAGRMYLKATDTIGNFLEERFGRDKELYYKVGISFEQIYHSIDGPSASLAEALDSFSAISGLPLKQCLAITGTMDQHGLAGVIGGVNKKIRAFFDACKEGEDGLTGEQGVVIPAANIQHLMLDEEIVKAVERGEFHVYSVETIEDALEYFMGENYSDIHQAMDDVFDEWRPREPSITSWIGGICKRWIRFLKKS